MITPAYSITATERVLPKLALDFTTASLDPRVSITRALNTATCVNSSGLIETVNANTARFDFSPVTLACKGLLIEESRINIQPASADMTNATYWAAVRASWPGTTITAPDGTNAGQKLVEDSSASTTHLGLSAANLTVVSGTTYTSTVYAKAGERSWFALAEGQGVTATVYFNVTTGAKGSTSGTGFVSSAIENAGNGWYRCSLTFTASGTAARIRLFLANGDGGTVYSGDGSSGLYFWGAQLEAGAFATSYIPTTTAALTRNADVATMTGANFSSWYNATEGAMLAEFSVNDVSSANFLWTINDGTVSQRMDAIVTSGGVATANTFIVANVSLQANITATSTVAVNNTYKMCCAYKTNSFITAANSVLSSEDTLGSVPTVDRLLLGDRVVTTSGAQFNGHMRKLSYWPQRLTNAEVRAFSK